MTRWLYAQSCTAHAEHRSTGKTGDHKAKGQDSQENPLRWTPAGYSICRYIFEPYSYSRQHLHVRWEHVRTTGPRWLNASQAMGKRYC